MLELVLIRHGEAEGQHTYLGRRSNPPLTSEGREKTALLRERLTAEGLLEADGARLFSSPQRRALETAGILFGDGTGDAGDNGPKIIDEFAEMDFGEWEGLDWREISMNAPEEYGRWLEDPSSFAPPGGETMIEFMSRVGRGIDAVAGDCEGRIFITAHGGVIRAMICSLLRLPVSAGMSFDVENSSCSIIRLHESPEGGRSAVLAALNLR